MKFLAALSGPRVSAWLFQIRHAWRAWAALVLLLASAGAGLAHGGPPLRLGVTKDPVVSSVARLVLVHLREGVGFAVDWREFPDAAALQAAFVGGKIDIAVVLTDPARLPPASASADCPPDTLASSAEALERRWGGSTFLLGFSAGSAVCVRPALVVTRAVLEDPRFGILGKEAARLTSLITQQDLGAVRAAVGRGGEREAIAAARAALSAKARR